MIADEQTMPLPGLDPAAVSREQFNAYLRRHNLTILDVALAAGLRLLYVWKVSRGEAVEVQYASAIRKALYALTHEPYMGLIAVQFTPVVPREQNERRQVEHWESRRTYL